jgi:hypothetical protein
LCRFTSPTPSALGVSHSLSDFSRPGLVALFRATSTHRISAFRAFSSRPAVTPLDALCSLAVSAGVNLPTTTERCSDREFVLGRPRLSGNSSRCSLDLFPLRGEPIQSLGFRPPLLRLLCLEPPHLSVLCLMASRRFRVSIRLDLEAAPKSGSNPRGVLNLFRSLQPSANRGRTRDSRSEAAHVNACLFNVPLGVTLCENPPPTEVGFAFSLGVT